MRILLLGLFLILFSCHSEEVVNPPVVNPPVVDEPTFESVLEFNPLGYTPLSAYYTLTGEENGIIQLTIKNIDGGDDLVKTFQKESEQISIPIHGLYYNHNNQVLLDFISNGNLTSLDTLEIKTGPQPSFFPDISVTIMQKDKMEPGMNFVNFRDSAPTIPFFVDNKGHIRYVLDFTTHPDLSNLNYDVGPERMKNGNWLFGAWPSNRVYETDMFGEVIHRWNIPGHSFHHTAHEKEDGHILVSTSKYGSEHPKGFDAIQDFVVELDRTKGNVILNEWDLKNSIDENRESQGADIWNNTQLDWAHINAVIDDPQDNTIIVSARFQGLIKLNSNNEVVWILNNHRGWGNNKAGEDLNDKLLKPIDSNGELIKDISILNGEENHPDFEWPWYQHAPEIDADGNIFLFDNGDKRNYRIDNQYSRAVGYKINESEMTVQQIWTYGKERGDECYSRIVSDVDIEPLTGNVLFCPGARVQNLNGFGGKIVELQYETKEVVFEMELNGNGIIFHRVERMPLYHEN